MEHGAGIHNSSIGVLAERGEGMVHGWFTVDKYREGESEPYESITVENAYTNTGGALLLDLLAAAGGTAYNAANAYLGVGDSNTAFAASQTNLQASTNKTRVAMDSTYPSRSGQVMSWKATFDGTTANWAWEETGIFNHASAGTMLCRSVSSLGTKGSGTTWTLTYTITVP